jgi:hypothetical protein
MFKINEKVVCIDDSKGLTSGTRLLKKGEIYTVIKTTNVGIGGILVAEIEPEKNDYNSYHYYINSRFRKIDYDFGKNLLEKLKNEVLTEMVLN